MSVHAEAAKSIRKFLKEQGVKSKVTSKTYAGGNSVYVTLFNVPYPQVADLEKVIYKHELGRFCGMTDSYIYDNRNENIPQVKYVFVRCEYSDEIKQNVLNHLHDTSKDDFENVPTLISEIDYNTVDSNGSYVNSRINELLDNRVKGFW